MVKTSYLKKSVGAPVPQSEPLNVRQVRNSAGGYAFPIDGMERLRRFLILGSEGGSYYASERKLTAENLKVVQKLIAADGKAVVDEIVRVSEGGMAPKNDPALFALALASVKGDLDTRRAAYAALPRVARIGTHLFHFADYRKALGGWSRGSRSAISRWYLEQDSKDLALQVVKYRQRDGWGHRDLLRLAHPKSDDETKNAILYYAVHGWDWVGKEPHDNRDLGILWATERVNSADITSREILQLIGEYRLPMEVIPKEKLSKEVYEAILPHAPLTFLLRNLGTLSKLGVIAEGQYSNLDLVTSKLTNKDALKRARVHPLSVLMAHNVYKQGGGFRSDATWPVIEALVDALDSAFYLAFDAIEPANKRFVLGLDISGSMAGPVLSGMPGITPMIGSAAMALVTARTEPKTVAMAFQTEFVPFPISKRAKLEMVVKDMQEASRKMGGTDCALPMIWALKNKVEADVFCVYTDSETWAGKIHPAAALNEYRQRMGIDAKLIVVGMTSSGFSIADPADAGMLDVVGFSTDSPAVMSEFAAGRI